MVSNSGKAEAIRQGVIWVNDNLNVDFFGYLDADLATPLSEIATITTAFEDNKIDIAFGSRVNLLGKSIKRTLLRHYLGRLFATYVSMVLNLDIYDTQCGAKYFRNNKSTISLFKNIFISKWFFDIEIFLQYRTSVSINDFNNNVKEIPLNNWAEKGNSKLRIIDFIKTPFEIIKIRNNNNNFLK